MPAVSKAQAHKIQMLYEEGKITKKTRDEFLKGVAVRKLPAKKGKK